MSFYSYIPFENVKLNIAAITYIHCNEIDYTILYLILQHIQVITGCIGIGIEYQK